MRSAAAAPAPFVLTVVAAELVVLAPPVDAFLVALVLVTGTVDVGFETPLETGDVTTTEVLEATVEDAAAGVLDAGAEDETEKAPREFCQ